MARAPPRGAAAQGARPQGALHGLVHPWAHLHAHLPGVGLGKPQAQAGVHLGENCLKLRPLVRVHAVVGGICRHQQPRPGQESGGTSVSPPVGLFVFRESWMAQRHCIPIALVQAIGNTDKALHPLTRCPGAAQYPWGVCLSRFAFHLHPPLLFPPDQVV